MLKEGVPSEFATASGLRFKVAGELDRRSWRMQRSPVVTWRSPARFGSLSAETINASDADIINLHWVTDGFLSIEEIGRITKPVVWSLYDMWPFAGTEHYGADTPNARWRTGYTKANRPADESGLDLDRLTWQRKRKNWRPMTIVPASTWLTEAAEASALMGDWPITRIPHVIDDTVFTPMTRKQARHQLGLDEVAPTIVFLASAGIGDMRKGFDLLEQALPEVKNRVQGIRVAIIGPKQEGKHSAGGVPIDWVGTVAGNEALRAAYCAGNVVAVPSREDNMPLTAMEAQTCGRAVVAFDIGGLPDIVEHHRTGYLAPAFDTSAMATGLIEAIEDSENEDAWGLAARARALNTWSPEVVVAKYLAVYDKALT